MGGLDHDVLQSGLPLALPPVTWRSFFDIVYSVVD